MSLKDLPQTYAEADAMLTGRTHDSRRVANNTVLGRRASDAIALRLHNTDVVTFYANGTVRLNTSGWRTATTKDRINRSLRDHAVSSERRVWYLYSHRGGVWSLRYKFEDYMLIDADGTVSTAEAPRTPRTMERTFTQSPDCDACGARTLAYLGKFGRLHHFRCESCGFDQSRGGI